MSTENKFTPGEWVFEEGYKGAGPWDRITIETKGSASVVICSVHRQINGDYREYDRSNFKLMAASKDLLTALEEMVYTFGPNAKTNNSGILVRSHAIDSAVKAIAKAKGVL